MGQCITKVPCYNTIPVTTSTKYEKYVPEINTGRVIKVYDGDTITIAGKVRYNPKIFKFSVRLNGLDCPEMKTKDSKEKLIAVKARDYVSKRELAEDMNRILDAIEKLNDKLDRIQEAAVKEFRL